MRNISLNSPAAAETDLRPQYGPESVDRVTRSELIRNGPEEPLLFWEIVKLKIIGFADGKDNLPAKEATDDGYLHSPFLTQEAKAYSEYETKIWTRIDADLYTSYARAGVILDSMRNINKKISLIKLPEPPSESELNQRHPGEADLDIVVVRNRRMNPYRREVARINAELNALMQSGNDYYEELAQIYHNIVESEKSARILCESRRDRVKERVAVYHRAAMKKNKSLPPTPDILLSDDGESQYDSQHYELRSAIAQALQNKSTNNNSGGNQNEI